MTDHSPDQPAAGSPPDLTAPPGGGWGDAVGAAPNEPPAPDFGADPYGRPAGESTFGTDPTGAGAAPDPGAAQPPPWEQPAGFPQPGAFPQQQQYPPQQYPPGAWGMGGAVGQTCTSCGNPVGATVHCVSCNQMVGLPAGYTLATAGDRFLQALLDGVLAFVTLGIGYLIWSIIIWKDGTTPAMKIMHLRCIKKLDRSVATRGTMAMREIVGGIVQGVLNYFIVGLVLYFMILWDKDRQLIWDKIAGTVVIKEPAGMPPSLPPGAYQG